MSACKNVCWKVYGNTTRKLSKIITCAKSDWGFMIQFDRAFSEFKGKDIVRFKSLKWQERWCSTQIQKTLIIIGGLLSLVVRIWKQISTILKPEINFCNNSGVPEHMIWDETLVNGWPASKIQFTSCSAEWPSTSKYDLQQTTGANQMILFSRTTALRFSTIN